MATKQRTIYLKELLIHPGETIAEILDERKISQKELAFRTGFSEKHISTVINGEKSVSAELATKLEYALDIPASFWRNLQTNYDLEFVTFNERNDISEEEEEIGLGLKKVVEQLTDHKFENKNPKDIVLDERKLLQVSDLRIIKSLNCPSYRAQFSQNTDEALIYAWHFLCEKMSIGQTDIELNIPLLRANLQRIKDVMFEDSLKHTELVRSILNECGILFYVAKDVKNASIKGATIRTRTNQVLITLTIRGKYIDIFWFTLFHEISHVLNGDFLKNGLNAEKRCETESIADTFAENVLIDPDLYKAFVARGDFNDLSIGKFARQVNVLPTIVIGRLMKDKYIPWSYNRHRELYIWDNDVPNK